MINEPKQRSSSHDLSIRNFLHDASMAAFYFLQWQLQYEVAGLRARVPPADCVIRSKLHKAHTYSRRGYLAFCEQVFRCRDRVALWSSGGDLGAPPKETELVRRFVEP